MSTSGRFHLNYIAYREARKTDPVSQENINWMFHQMLSYDFEYLLAAAVDSDNGIESQMHWAERAYHMYQLHIDQNYGVRYLMQGLYKVQQGETHISELEDDLIASYWALQVLEGNCDIQFQPATLEIIHAFVRSCTVGILAHAIRQYETIMAVNAMPIMQCESARLEAMLKETQELLNSYRATSPN